MMEEHIGEQTLATVKEADAAFLTEEQLQQVRDMVREREKDGTEKLEVHKPSLLQLQQLQRLQLPQVRDTRQEFVPNEEASVLPKYLDNVDAELEGHLVTIPVVHDTEFRAGTIEKKEILDYGDEGKYTLHTDPYKWIYRFTVWEGSGHALAQLSTFSCTFGGGGATGLAKC